MTLEQFKPRRQGVGVPTKASGKKINFNRIPDVPGVYFFLGKRKDVLYIGKATSLRDRVRSYFANDLMETRGPLLVQMLQKAHSIDWRVTDSVLEALLLEASLIRTHKPKHNTDFKDDKSFNYVVITKEGFPQIIVMRGKELERLRKSSPLRRDEEPYSSVGTFASPYKIFGPFSHGLQLQEALKLIRKIFPYRDAKCKPNQGRPCFNRQIGLCPGVCTGEVTKEEYRRTIRHIVLLFEGKKKQLIKTLGREMKAAAKEEDFELAQQLRRQIYALEHIQDVSLIKEEFRSHTIPASVRIEAYDIAHLRGGANVGVMVVVEDGAANKSQYRKFRIKTAKGGDDAGALREVLSRRLGHDEWPLPRMIAVDGSTAQMNAARHVLEQYGVGIPIVGVVKDEKHRPRSILGDRDFIAGRERDILLANTEAHRFAIGYHRKKLRRQGLSNGAPGR